MEQADRPELVEIPIVGDLTEHQSDLFQRLLEVEPGGACLLYFDSLGGSPYVAVGLTSVILLRDLDATGVVVGECSSAALWPFAACRRRIVTPFSVLFFHPLRWQSEENVALPEAAEWARHFGQLEGAMDRLLAQLLGIPEPTLQKWSSPGRYVSGTELAETGAAELVALEPLDQLRLRRKGRKPAGRPRR